MVETVCDVGSEAFATIDVGMEMIKHTMDVSLCCEVCYCRDLCIDVRMELQIKTLTKCMQIKLVR